MRRFVSGKVLIFAFLVFCFSTEGRATDLPFHFTKDQALQQMDNDIPYTPEKDLQKDEWIMSPPSRLELIIYFMAQYFEKEANRYWAYNERKISSNFEKQSESDLTPIIDARVIFNLEKDAIAVSFSIDGLGKPKKPMKEVCGSVLDAVTKIVNSEGYSYQRTFLKPFILKDYSDPEIGKIVKKLEKNIIFAVYITSQYEGKHYSVRCADIPGQDRHYSKGSFQLKKIDPAN